MDDRSKVEFTTGMWIIAFIILLLIFAFVGYMIYNSRSGDIRTTPTSTQSSPGP